jgi:predicted HTH transcriptional regulator
MSVHANSVDCYHAEKAKLSKRADAVLAWVTEKGPRTDREIAYGMGFGENLNAVRPRITELIDAGLLMEVGDVRCPVTSKRVRRVDIRRPRQLDLIQ